MVDSRDNTDPNQSIRISKIWAHAWTDYLFYDTELFFSVIRNKNYELPDPPVDYSFISTANDPMLNVNIFHALIIRIFHTPYYGTLPKGAFKDRDLALIEEVMAGTISETKTQLIERQTRKMILKMMQSPENWSSWLQLFDEEDIYEETVGATPDHTDQTPKETPETSFVGHLPTKDLKAAIPKLNLGGIGGQTGPTTAPDQKSHVRGWSQLGMPKLDPATFPAKKDFVLMETISERQEFDDLEKGLPTSRFKKESFKEAVFAIKEQCLSDLDSQFLSPRFSHFNVDVTERSQKGGTERLIHRRNFTEMSDRQRGNFFTSEDIYRSESP